MKQPYTLFGAEVSLFSGKARSYLRYKGIPFEECLATVKVVNQDILPNTGMRMIPVVKSPEGEYIQDTTAIIDYFESRFEQRSVYPSGDKQRFLSLLLELYADEWLLLPAMHYRWHYKRANLGFILKEFGACAMPNLPGMLQPLAGLVPALYFGRLYGPVLGITPRNRQAVEQWYERFLKQFDQHLERSSFLFGECPSIADFGFIGPLYAHLYRDPYSGELMRRIAPNVYQWVERMMQPQENNGSFANHDAVSDTLIPILQHMQATHYPVLSETVKRVALRLEQAPDDRLPRFLGKMAFTLEGITEQRYVNTYAQWMLQRPLDFYHGLPENRQAALKQWLTEQSLDGLLSIEIEHSIERRQNRLYSKLATC